MYEVAFTLSLETQRELLALCREIVSAAPLFQKTMPNGAKFRYLCTSAGDYGWFSDRKGYRYETLHPLTEQPFPAMPDRIAQIAHEAVAHYDETIVPQSALINWYTPDSKLGLHQDNTEECAAPVVSISLGDDCLFVKGGETRSSAKETLTLHSGDVFVMGGAERYHYHGVKKILTGTAPPALEMRGDGRVNITVRQVYAVESA